MGEVESRDEVHAPTGFYPPWCGLSLNQDRLRMMLQMSVICEVSVMLKKLGLLLIVGVLASSYSVFAQALQERIPQAIIVNGQQAQGVLVVENGTIQSQTCPAPQQYVAADQSSSGWACFETSTGVWLLHAQPPAQASAPQQAPTVIYGNPSPVYVPAPAYYGYGYYPYGYPYYGYPYVFGPTFAFGFGFGYRAPIFVGRSFVGRPFAGRPFAGRPFPGRPGVVARPFAGGFRSGGFGGARGGRR